MISTMNLYKRLLISLLVLFLPIFMIQPALAANANDTKGQFVQSRYSADTIEVKFSESSEVSLQNDEFVSQTNANLSATNKLLKDKKATNKRALVSNDTADLRNKQKQLRAQGVEAPDLTSYYRVKLEAGQNTKDVANQLKQLPGIVEAYPAPIPAPAPSTPNMTSFQTYLTAAPSGMGITPATSLPGSNGKNVKIADLEYSWSTTHEDLPKNRLAGAYWPIGSPSDPFSDTNHGTAVSGIIGGARNSFGIDGIASGAEFHMVNTYSSDLGWDVPSAIYGASSRMSAGDVILLEQQTYDANNNLVPVEWIPSVYDAIKAATASGIVVVEAAANGGVNLNDPAYGTTFPSGKPDSGALMVGAGSACATDGNHYRLGFSNYGSRVNVQGNGHCVMSTGYGSFYGSNATNDAYINGFSGTSSASALMAATVGALSSSYEDIYKKPATPALIRSTLINTGTAQYTAFDTGHIGPLPNLKAAIKSLDTTPPSVPQNVTISLNSLKQPVVKWAASTDNSTISRYRIYRNGALRTSTASLQYTDKNITLGTTYSYQIQTVDVLGNVSAKSATVTVTPR